MFVVGVGPGSPKYLTEAVKDVIRKSVYIIGYEYTLTTIEDIIDFEWQKVYKINMKNQEEVFQNVYYQMKEGDYCTVPFTGDANFSESEVVDRLIELFGDGNVEIIPGISSIQVAAAKAKIPLDKSQIISFHVTGDIEEKKLELIKAIIDGKSVILLPRPWPRDPSKNFMQSDIAFFLKINHIDTSNLSVWIFEHLTKDNKETVFKGRVNQLEGRQFSDLSVMVIDQVKRHTYLQFD